MRLSDFDYKLPKELIADDHVEPRDHSRLLVLDRVVGQIRHKKFFDITDYLEDGDVLVFNNSKVFKARIYGNKETGGKVEMLLVRPVSEATDNCCIAKSLNCWEVLVKGKVSVGNKILFENKLKAEIVEKKERGCVVRFNFSAEKVFKYLEKYGEIPLPPYIGRNPNNQPPMTNQILNLKSKTSDGTNKIARYRDNNSFYQTVYAKNTGSVAAPTAGFHFTDRLLDKLKKKGIECLEVTLHVGPGTFLPVEVDDVKKHKMHEEFFEVKKSVWKKVLAAKSEGRRVVAVGTTTCRVLETLGENYKQAQNNKSENPNENLKFENSLEIRNLKLEIEGDDGVGSNKAFSIHGGFLIGATNIFIYPPYEFKIVDALITNFHLPKSTLLMLISAFADPGGKRGVGKIKKAYKEAIAEKYRFYSFGDSMFIK